jgi:predicted nucleotidyltransferase component of viral defense system
MIEIIQQRLASYQVSNVLAETQALKEIVQEIALYALWRANFFNIAAFQGGTSLRILHRLPRFSEDLDFILKTPAIDFDWQQYRRVLIETFTECGLKMSVIDKKDQMAQPIKQAILKNDAIANQLTIAFPPGERSPLLKIKLEIDISPPKHSEYAWSYLDFPLDFEVCHQDLPSNFALKIHALLCRSYLKGRDWFDFTWYLSRKVVPNFRHLQAALDQAGPWQGQAIMVDLPWLQQQLLHKINQIDWQQAKQDVERFLPVLHRRSLNLWSRDFFAYKIGQL